MAEKTLLAIVVDDEPDIRQMVQVALESEGWRVRTATTGREGLALMHEQLPDVLIVDLMMSGMTGLELCHRVVSDFHTTEIPVLLVSGVNEKARVLQDFWDSELQHKNFLRKPFDLQALMAAVRELLPPGKAGQLTPAQATPAAGAYTSAPPELPTWMQPSRPIEPKAPAPAPAPAAAPAPPAPDVYEGPKHTGYRVLVMDDEPDIRMILETAIGMHHTVESAENGMEGLRKLDSFLPDFILSDINMPVMNGLDTAEAIRRHPVLYRVPIFFLTAETGKDMPKRAYDVGGNLFLRKPVDPMRVLKCIDFFLGETGLKPNTYYGKVASGGTVAAAPAAPSAASAGGAGGVPPRILTVDFNIENQALLKRLLGDGTAPGEAGLQPLELIWTEDPRAALGNLTRWAPDLILYNPRNPNLDGVAFGQTLKLQKVGSMPVVLCGTRLYEADVNYSQRVLKTPLIDLNYDMDMLRRRLTELIDPLRATARPKQLSLEKIHAEDAERMQEMQATNAKAARERESFRQRYTRIQEFIDRTNFN